MAVFDDVVQNFQLPAVSRGVELKVHGPQLVRVLGLMTPNGAVHWTSLFLLSVSGPLVTLLLPKVLHSLVVHQLSLLTQRAVRQPPASTDSFCCDLVEPTPQPCFLNVENLAGRHAVGFCAVGPPPSRRTVPGSEVSLG